MLVPAGQHAGELLADKDEVLRGLGEPPPEELFLRHYQAPAATGGFSRGTPLTSLAGLGPLTKLAGLRRRDIA